MTSLSLQIANTYCFVAGRLPFSFKAEPKLLDFKDLPDSQRGRIETDGGGRTQKRQSSTTGHGSRHGACL